MHNPNNTIVFSYGATPSQVQNLREICIAWSKDGDFWAFDSVLKSLEQRTTHIFFSAEQEHAPWRGAAIYQHILDQADLIYLYVCPEFRRSGIAHQLLAECVNTITKAASTHSVLFNLEVRPSNLAAIALYQKLGFEFARKIPRYYADGSDADCYQKECKK